MKTPKILLEIRDLGSGTRMGASMVFAIGFVLCLAAQPPAVLAQCQPMPVANIASSQPPSDVAAFPGGCIPINYFDDFSWRSFIALVWPASNGQRGVAGSGPVTSAGPRVFETYKALWETFHNDGAAPSTWNNYDGTSENPCTLNNPAVNVQWGNIVLASWSHYSNFDLAGFGTLAGPLPAQNQSWIAYMAAFNETQFNQILNTGWFKRANLPATLTFNNGAISVKSSWMNMKGNPNASRYYTRTAWLMDPATGQCSQTTVGLVGLHIVQKTPNSPQWIWSSFEQVDNVPPVVAGGPGTFNLNDGTGNPMPPSNPYKSADPLSTSTPKPFNVTRVKPIHASTQATNKAYQALLKQQNPASPWQYYQLVMTQWPIPQPSPSSNPGTPPNTFPGSNPPATTAFANTTMEPFEQGSVFTGCMACHNVANSGAPSTDFEFSLKDHAFPSTAPDLMFSESLRQLRTLLTPRAARTNAAPAKKPATKPKKPAGHN